MNTQSGIIGAITGIQAEQDRRFEVPNRLGMYLSELLSLPMLRGLWLVTGDAPNGDALDSSPNVRLLTANGAPLWTFDRYVVPAVIFDGASDFSRITEAGLELSGAEAYVDAAAQGMSIGCWIYPTVAAAQTLMGKWAGGVNFAYRLALTAGNQAEYSMSNDGSSGTVSTNTTVISLGAWSFIAATFAPGGPISTYVNSDLPEVGGGAPANIFNSAANFRIGADDDGNYLTGNMALAFLCASCLSQSRVGKLWRWGRAIFGV